jgi:hypothetical protein
MFERFKSKLSSSYSDSDFLIGREKEYNVFYIPFEFVNTSARLVLVGITPGPTQMKCAYATAQRALASDLVDSEILRIIKQNCAFSGMRDRINEMLDHFNIPQNIGVESASSLWTTNFKYLQPTSIIPNATFKGSDYFNGPFSTILQVSLLRKQFENEFIPSISNLSKEALYIGMGPIVDEALQWCSSRGVINEQQIVGYFPHASGNSGSQFAYFMRRKQLSDLKPKDPVRYRVRDLDAAYERITRNLQTLFSSN